MTNLPSKAELQLGLDVPSPEKRAKGAVGPRNSTMFRKLAVQRVGLQRSITVHSVLGASAMMLLGSLHSRPEPARKKFDTISLPIVIRCPECGAPSQSIGMACEFCHAVVTRPKSYSVTVNLPRYADSQNRSR